MSHIVRFTVTGLAGRAEAYSQQLHRDLNIFFGLNGTGKTSLLKILHSALTGDASILARVPFQTAEVTIYSLKFEREFTATISHPSRSRERVSRKKGKIILHSELFEHELIPRKVITGEEDVLKWIYKTPLPEGVNGGWQDTYLPTWRLQPKEMAYQNYALDSRGRPKEYDWDEFFARSLEQLWTAYTTRLLSSLQAIQSDGLVGILKAIMKSESTSSKRGKFDADVAFNRVRAFLSRQGAAGMLDSKEYFERRYSEDEQLRRVVDNINSIEQKVEETKAARNSLQRLITDMFIGTKRVVFEDTRIRVLNEQGQEIQLELLSSGEKQAMLIFIDTLLAADSSLFIDEPEISLHVDWQRRLVSDMRLLNPSAQFILATHAPEIMAEVHDDNIFRL